MSDDCIHPEIYFGSGDYYLCCANIECMSTWVMCGDGDEPDPYASNKSDRQIGLSSEERVKK